MASAVPSEPVSPGNTLAAEVTPAPIAVPAKPEAAEVTAADLEAEFGVGDDPATGELRPAAEQVAEGKQAAGAADDVPVKQQTAEERIAELVAEAHTARRERDVALAEAASLRPKEPDTPAKAPDPDAEPDSANYEFGEADTQFIKDAAAHAAKMAVRAEMASQVAAETRKTQVKELETKQETIFTAGKDKYPDFEEKVIKAAAENKFPLGQVATLAVLHSPAGQDIAYYLATNPSEAERIDKLPSIQEQAYEMGKLAARFETGTATAPAPVRPTNAPPPPKTLARGDGGKFSTPDDTDDFKAFEAKADAMMIKR